ncbi:MAG: hypothetical protein KDK23_17310, partial [Leptospiraceae bacterium]|nr:hypothetical protein [Leptospiraceae bacterium]
MSERSSLALKAVTMRGLEEVLAEEIRQLGGKDVRPARGVVLFRGDFLLLYSCCYYLRTAMRVLLELGSTR